MMITKSLHLSSPLYRRFLTTKFRHNSTSITPRDAQSRISDWIMEKMTVTSPSDEVDVIDSHRLRLLDLTLPPFSKDAPRVPMLLEDGTHIIPGTEITFFPPLVRTSNLLSDGTDNTYSSPAPFHRRMWAGGEFAFDPENRLCVGQRVSCKTTIEDVQLKGWEKAGETGELGNDTMVFVKQRREISNDNGIAVVERRTHVYRPELFGSRSVEVVRKKGVMMHSDERFTFTPSAHTLFRFSALTFNSHRIHLDPVYSFQQEGYEDRLVHGPLTSLLLLRFACFLAPSEKQIVAFKYRATHPIVVDHPLTLNLRWTNKHDGAEVWATSDEDIVGMKGTVVLVDKSSQSSFVDYFAVDGINAGLFAAAKKLL